MNNFKKKGFTLVELVIVIAVVAILAAVLIPTFSSIIGKANLSADQSAVRNMNTALATSKISDGVIDNPSEAREALADFGFDSSDLVPTSYNHRFYWNKTYNVVLLVDCTNADESMWTVIFPTNGYDEAIAEFNNIETRYETNFNLANLPNATVTPINVILDDENVFENGKSWGAFDFINLGADETLPLDIALKFKANDSYEDAVNAEYGDWLVDFVVILDNDLSNYPNTTFYLAGMYDNPFTKTLWVVPTISTNDGSIKANTPYKLLETMQMSFTYSQICDTVKEFNCGITHLKTAPTGLTVTLKLVMYEPISESEEYNEHIIYEYKYTYPDNTDNQQ